MTTIRFEVLPSDEGGWIVTRDCVVTAGFDCLLGAERHALKSCLTAAISGTAANLVVIGNDGALQQDRTFLPDARGLEPLRSDAFSAARALPSQTN